MENTIIRVPCSHKRSLTWWCSQVPTTDVTGKYSTDSLMTASFLQSFGTGHYTRVKSVKW